MTYRCRPGIVLEKICGTWLLIPTREASVYCPAVHRLTLPSALLWGMLEEGKSKEDTKKALTILTHKTDEEIETLIRNMLQSFIDKNLVIAEGEDA